MCLAAIETPTPKMLPARRPGEKIDTICELTPTVAPPGVHEDLLPSLPGRRPERPRQSRDRLVAELCEAQTPQLRRHLQAFGARGDDLDDLVQEVFLVLHAKREILARVRPLDPWLREVCRRVAAGHRRRAHRRHEVAFGEPLEPMVDEGGTDSAFEEEERQLRLHLALTRLDEYSRHLVALHEIGNLPLGDMAELIAADRKTVRKRLSTALRRLTTLLGSRQRWATSARADPAPGISRPRQASEFRVLARHAAVSVGLVGSVLVAVWPGAATLEALEIVEQGLARAAEICGGSAVFFGVVEATTRPPDLPARGKLVAMLEDPRHHMSIYVAALEGGAAWLARPIMSALGFLARTRLPMQYFEGAPRAARWLIENYPDLALTDEASLLRAVSALRSTSPGEVGERPTSG
jgi:RNA polymerase sigma-70 factor (ECF subfamily)